MNSNLVQVLLVEDNPLEAKITKTAMESFRDVEYHLVHVDSLYRAIEAVSNTVFDLILLDLMLPDSMGLNTLKRLKVYTGNMPIVIVSGNKDEDLAQQAVKAGAQDYILKGDNHFALLPRAVRYSLERAKLVEEIRSLSLRDDLTGLHNRRGYLVLLGHHLQIANREKALLTIAYMDLENLKYINDRFGQREGDRALLLAAQVLKRTFRKSDVLARVGGDEYAVLYTDYNKKDFTRFRERLKRNQEAVKTENKLFYNLVLNVGFAEFDPANPCPVEDLMNRAVADMQASREAQQ